MKLLQIAVENQRWDLAAHTIVLATAFVLKNGDKPHVSQKVSNNPSVKTAGRSGVGRMTKTGGKEFGREKRRSQG